MRPQVQYISSMDLRKDVPVDVGDRFNITIDSDLSASGEYEVTHIERLERSNRCDIKYVREYRQEGTR
jgi:hypothetical protein